MRSFALFCSALLLSLVVIPGCISLRSDIDGAYSGTQDKTLQRTPVSVYFYFSHLEQEKGLDVVPKIIPPRRGFRDIFGESMKELSNVKSFESFTDQENDIDNAVRRRQRDSLKTVNDFTIHLTIKKENSFAKHFLADLVVWGTATIVPVGFSWEYIVTADVSNSSGKFLKSYTRRSTVTSWHHFLFLFVYPFLPSEVKIEEIYLESLQNIFRQIEVEGVLSK
jgi:hypothetical protein